MALGKLQDEASLQRWLEQNYPILARPASAGPRIIRGIVDTSGSGSVTAGEGFSVTRNGAGDVTISFDFDFTNLPVVTVSRFGPGVVNVSGLPSKATVGVIVRDTGFTAADGSFGFTAVET
jgi:hypothetical protein